MARTSARPRPAVPRPGGAGQRRRHRAGTSEAAEAVSDALRRQTDDFQDRRPQGSRLTFGAMGSLGMVAAYQLGLLRHLPDPPLGPFESDRVDASGGSYQ